MDYTETDACRLNAEHTPRFDGCYCHTNERKNDRNEKRVGLEPHGCIKQ